MFSRVMERELKRKAESWLDEGTDEALRPRQAPKTSLSAVVDNLRQLEEAIPWSNVVSSWEYKQRDFTSGWMSSRQMRCPVPLRSAVA